MESEPSLLIIIFTLHILFYPLGCQVFKCWGIRIPWEIEKVIMQPGNKENLRKF